MEKRGGGGVIVLENQKIGLYVCWENENTKPQNYSLIFDQVFFNSIIKFYNFMKTVPQKGRDYILPILSYN